MAAEERTMSPACIAFLLFGLAIGYGIGRHRHPICWWDAIRLRLRTGKCVIGHVFADRERVDRCIVQTAQCERCDEWIVGWQRTAQSADVSEEATR
jgi:hypothetical protein